VEEGRLSRLGRAQIRCLLLLADRKISAVYIRYDLFPPPPAAKMEAASSISHARERYSIRLPFPLGSPLSSCEQSFDGKRGRRISLMKNSPVRLLAPVSWERERGESWLTLLFSPDIRRILIQNALSSPPRKAVIDQHARLESKCSSMSLYIRT